MEKSKLAMQNATYAIKARNALVKGGVKAKIVRLIAPTEGGCTHGIEILSSELLRAADILRRSNIVYKLIKENDDIS